MTAKSEVTEDAVAKFGELTSIVDRIEVDADVDVDVDADLIRLYGRKEVLEQCVIAGGHRQPGCSH